MADQKLSALTSATGAAESDDLYIVTDTSTTPVSKKITFDNLQNSFTDISLNSAQFDITNTTLPIRGQIAYNATDANLKLGLAGNDVQVALGQELVLPKRVRNSSGTTMTKGTVVYISGVSGSTPVISRALATSDATSALTIGMTSEDIADNTVGWVTTFGILSGINLSSFTAGDTLYLSGTTAGTYTNVKPAAPIHYVRVGIVTKATASGELMVYVINGYELDEIHDVSIISKANGDVLQYESSTNLWKNVPLSTAAAGYLKLDLSNTPLTGNTLNFNGTAAKTISVDRTLTAATAGRALTITAGGAYSSGTNLAGGDLLLKGGISTGSAKSAIKFYTAQNGTSGTTDQNPTQKMVITGEGYVGINVTFPTNSLEVNGNVSFQGGTLTTYGDITASGGNVTGSNLSGTNTGDQNMPVYGDGADGYVDFNTNNTYSFASFDGSFTYTLTRDVFATYINVNSSVIVITAGYRLFAQYEISNYGTIHNNGANASGTTAGAGGLGGFFKAGGTGATGLLAASAGANGTAQATPTANTWVGGLGGKGGQGRASTTTFVGGQITIANITTPANADGGSKVTSNYINYLNRYVVAATNWQMTPSIGGGSGAKSIIGTTATSGGGGGGGGICFVAAPVITGVGTISANGGAGGNAAGTGGSFGGGGGGGGGVMCMIAKTSDILPTANGGTGGTSVFGTNGTLPVATANGTNTTATTTLTITPTIPLTKGKLYLITFHLNLTAGVGSSVVNNISGYGMQWYFISSSRVDYSTIAVPTRAQETWYGRYETDEPDLVQNNTITATLSDVNTTARAIIDEISNVDADYYNNPLTSNTATNSVNSAATLTVTLPTAPTAGNLVYSVFTRSGGTATTAGSGNTLVNNQTTAPQITSQVSSAQQANIQTHTTAAAVAGFSIEITKSTSGSNGSIGWAGKVVRIYG